MSAANVKAWRVGDAGHTVFGPPNGKPSPETIARVLDVRNAPLLAAAPELYAALERLLESIGCGEPSPDDSPAVKFARAALSKARGEGVPS